MLHHVSVGVRDVERAAKFYDAVLGALGYRRVMEFLPYAIGYGEAHPTFWVQLPHNQQAGKRGQWRRMSASSRAARMRCIASTQPRWPMAGSDDGAPGPRPDYGPDYYGAFVYDLDGNKLEATVDAASAEVLAMTKANKMAEGETRDAFARSRKKAAPKKKIAKRKAKKR